MGQDGPVGRDQRGVGDDRVCGDQAVEGVARPGEAHRCLRQFRERRICDLQADASAQRRQWRRGGLGYPSDFEEVGQLQLDDRRDEGGLDLQSLAYGRGDASILALVEPADDMGVN